MFRRSELAAAVLVAGVALALAPMEARTSLVPAGLVAGLAGLRTHGPAVAIVRGSKAGALGGMLFVLVVSLGRAVQISNLVSAWYAPDVLFFTGFTMLVMLVPLYGIEGMLAAPIVRWLDDVGRDALASIRGAEK